MNHLAGATSPYLRQHAENPVEWYPWGDEALRRARTEDKPLFVSIGYAACHWCHVMAHESFEDPAVADDLTRSFVSVKVDREERPDVDAVYMAATQAMTGGGGWPMSVFCTPDGRPFFAGTYFPPDDRHGLPSFRRVLRAVADAWRERRGEVEAQAGALLDAIAKEARAVDRLAAGLATGAPAGMPSSASLLRRATGELGDQFDARDGGFGSAPKFPHPSLVELCLRHHVRTDDPTSLEMATTTLDAMAAGGIYDHLQGGFARYSTDARWRVPHFEKMLTDQALLARTYLRAWQLTGNLAYRQVATETIDATLSTMRAPAGGLCSSIDADAGGVEGAHQTWTPGEVRAALRAAGLEASFDPVSEWYGINERAASAELAGRVVPHRPPGAPLERPAEIETARCALLEARGTRPQPARDDKVLTEWNAMFVATLAEAAGACGVPGWARAAEEVAEGLWARNRGPDGRWRRLAGGEVPGFAADYAWAVEACLRMAALTGGARWTERAVATADALLDQFWDADSGGLFTSGHDAERLVVRAKDVVDGAVPAASSIGALALLRLGALTGEPRFSEHGRRLVELAAPLLERRPTAVGDLVGACGLLDEGAEVVVVGDRPDLVEVVRHSWLPDAVVAWGEPVSSPLWEGRRPGAAYVCRRFVCAAPAADPGTLLAQLVPLGARPRR